MAQGIAVEFFTEAGKQVGTTANSVASHAGFLDGEMDAKGMCSYQLWVMNTRCWGLCLGSGDRIPSCLFLLLVLPNWLLLQPSAHQSFSFKSLLSRRTW